MHKLSSICIIILGVLNVTSNVHADSPVTVGTGFEYAIGDYGGDVDIEFLFVPVLFFHEQGPWQARLEIPWIQLRAPDKSFNLGDGRVVPGNQPMKTESGLGDVEFELRYATDWFPEQWFYIDVLGELKLPTADERKGLGTGETDFQLEFQFFKTFDKITPMAFIAHRWQGEPEGAILRDVFSISVGVDYRIDKTLNIGAIYEYQEPNSKFVEELQELEVYFKYEQKEKWSIVGYAYHGFTDASPRFGIGSEVQFHF